jgi:hypothetical protein
MDPRAGLDAVETGFQVLTAQHPRRQASSGKSLFLPGIEHQYSSPQPRLTYPSSFLRIFKEIKNEGKKRKKSRETK